jgi:16S rRNA (cytosine967-C5)-methyltransferase
VGVTTPDRRSAARPASKPRDAHKGGASQGGRSSPAGGPPGLAVRRAAAAILERVLDKGHALDQEIEALAARQGPDRLDPRDRALVRAILGVTLRRLGEIDRALKDFLDRPLPAKAINARHALRIGAAQILFMDVPDHASVSLAVETVDRDPRARAWKALVNGVLRGVAREADRLRADESRRHLNTPRWLEARWTAAYGADAARAIAAAHTLEPTLDLTVKSDPAGWAERLNGRLLPTGTVRLIDAGAIEELPGYTDGEWWVQDAAAALPARLLGDVKGLSVADLCAAPGGKSAQLAHAGARLTALDQSAQRLDRLRQNLARLRLEADIIAADAGAYRPDTPFDAVLLDAPCSSTGTIRRHPDVARHKSLADVEALAAIQARLLDHAVDITRPGGRIVYSTCSLEPEEGEEQVRALLSRRSDVALSPITTDEIGGLAEAVTPEGFVRTLPCHGAVWATTDEPRWIGLDGFFAARLVRLGDN